MIDALLQDLRYAVRMVRNNPGFSLIVAMTLALGIGANTAIFTLLDQILLRSLPVRDPQQLVQLQFVGSDSGRTSSRGGSPGDYFSYPMYRDLRDRSTVFNGVLATYATQVGVQWHNQPDLATAELVSGNYFETLGVHPAMGRLFVQSDDVVQQAKPVAVLSFNYWQRRFGGDPGILNQTVVINAHPFTVIGIAPKNFHSIVVEDAPDVFATMMMKAEITPGWNDLDNRRSRWLNIFARLKPGVSRNQGEAEINNLWHSIRTDELKDMKVHSATFREKFVEKSRVNLLDGARGFSPLRDVLRTPLLIVMGMVGLVMLIACANVAGLLSVRAVGRMKEISVRYALGARRSRILQQLLIEGLLLGLAGGAVGVMLSPYISALLVQRMASGSPNNLPFSVSPDLRILAFSFVLSLVVSILFSLAPAFHFWRPDLTPALKQQTTTAAGGTMRFRRASVGIQIGLSLLLLFGAGLFARTLYNLRTLDAGFATDHLLTFGIDPKLAGYQPEQIPALYQRLLTTLGALPGVRMAAATNDPLLANNNESTNVTVSGYNAKEDEDMNVEWSIVTPSFFSTLEIPLVAGRGIGEQDGPDAAKVVVINESMARHFFGDPQRAIGQSLGSGAGNGVKMALQIVGVVSDAKHETLRNEVPRTVFVPLLQSKEAGFIPLQFYARTSQAPESTATTIRAALQRIDSGLVPDTMRSMEAQIDDSLNTERMIALLAASFGVLAALLAAVGLYGVLAYSTAQRTREIGIRIALGASRTAVVRLVLSEVAMLVGLSIAVAVPLALSLSRLLRSQLFGVSNNDPWTLAAITGLVAAMALLAAWIPMRRAAGVDPMVALRYE
ncbi:MAG: ABC transporter permease [Acidobacteriia bacterium]|nr:ABC transporter permease [Terriglobia bacterium]